MNAVATRNPTVADDRWEKVLWAIVGQACEDATSLTYCEREGCPYAEQCEVKLREIPFEESPSIALLWLKQTLGEEHLITRRVVQLRAEGKKINVNLHTQDNLKRARRAK